ncbi:MAG: aminomethyl-transferring glycine dehydrogenase subunit GcvPB [Candidatus Dormibacteria bacterium]
MELAAPKAGWAGAEPLLFELGHDYTSAPTGLDPSTEEFLPPHLARTTPPRIPRIPEPLLARHFGRLARRNHNIHQGMYPLGSCTMKYNPVLNEEIASYRGFADLHPYQVPSDAQGTLRLLFELERALIALTGMSRVSLQPAAGAQGEWTGLRMIQAYHEHRGDHGRTVVLIPDSAHGTNPASAALCGYEVVSIRSNPDGTVNLEDCKEHLTASVAAVMLTNPNTYGAFEHDIREIAQAAHNVGALLYYDGANLNAMVGVARPGDMGFDVVHLNLHKTFSTPHGGGGPGAGPVGVKHHLEPFLPVPTVELVDTAYVLSYDRPESIGKVRAFYGNVGMLIRAYAYICAYGNTIREVAEGAVLNARYLHHLITKDLPAAVTAIPMHEFVVTTKGSVLPDLKAQDIAKRLLDFGVYPPTMYFPTTVPEALMIEPTETESKQTLEEYARIVHAILEEFQHEPESAHLAPLNTPVRRVDEVRAARFPDVRWHFERESS